MTKFEREPQFQLGQVLVTLAVIEALHPADILEAVDRHHSGDLGEIAVAQRDLNDDSWEDNELFSAYCYNGTKFSITTSRDRRQTLVRLEEEREREEELEKLRKEIE